MVEEIKRGMKLINVLTAQARNERVDAADQEDVNKAINVLLEDPNPNNRYRIAQTIAFSVSNLQQQESNFLSLIGDVKNIGYGDKAQFSLPTSGIKAFIQAKASTTPRSMIYDKHVTVSTVEVSTRPAVNLYELRSGRRDMADLIRRANTAVSNKKLEKIQAVITAAFSGFSSPSPAYTSGSGIDPTNFDSQLLYFRRMGGAAIVGDYAALDKLALLTGFTAASSTQQFADNVIEQYHRTGVIGSYKGAPVIPLQNVFEEDPTKPMLDPGYIYILAVGISPDDRALKVVNEGDVLATEATHIDNLLYEVRLDQLFGAAYLVGDLPTVGIYNDSTL